MRWKSFRRVQPWLNSSKTLSSHSLLDYTKWTLLTLNGDPVLTDFNLSTLNSIPIQLTSISDLNLESEYQESLLELTKIHSEAAASEWIFVSSNKDSWYSLSRFKSLIEVNWIGIEFNVDRLKSVNTGSPFKVSKVHFV